MLPQDLVASARLRYLGTSAQKTRLVVDLIRGKDVGEAAATLRFTKKAVARDLARLLDSVVANARQKRQDVDVDRLYVSTVFVDGGPSLKRIQPAPMGRAFRILKRMCHVTIGVGERAAAAPPVRRDGEDESPRRAAPAAQTARLRRTAGADKTGAKAAAKSRGRRGRATRGKT